MILIILELSYFNVTLQYLGTTLIALLFVEISSIYNVEFFAYFCFTYNDSIVFSAYIQGNPASGLKDILGNSSVSLYLSIHFQLFSSFYFDSVLPIPV